MGEYPSDETPHMIDELPLQDTAQDLQLPTQAIGAQFPSVDQEGSFQHRAVRTRSPVYREEDQTTPDSHAGSGTVSERPTSHSTRPSLNTHQSSPGNCIVSPVPSLCRARARARTITSTSGVSRRKQTEGDRNQVLYGDEGSNRDGRQDFRSYESPFARRVKERLREVHVHDYEPRREPSNRAVELPSPAEDVGRDGEPEILGAGLIPSCHTVAGYKRLTLDTRTIPFAGAIEYQGSSFSACILRGQRHKSGPDQAPPRAHRQAKIIDGTKKAQRGTRARICDGKSEDDRRTRFLGEEIIG